MVNIRLTEPESTTNSNSNDNNSQNLHVLEDFIDVLGGRDHTSSTTDNRPDDSHRPKDLTFNIHHNFMTHVLIVRDTSTIGLYFIHFIFLLHSDTIIIMVCFSLFIVLFFVSICQSFR